MIKKEEINRLTLEIETILGKGSRLYSPTMASSISAETLASHLILVGYTKQKEDLDKAQTLLGEYKHFIEFDIERLYYIIENAEKEYRENEDNISVWSVGRETDYDNYEEMSALEDRIGTQRLSRLVAELKKGVEVRGINTEKAEKAVELEEESK